jgi:hypothetical protein
MGEATSTAELTVEDIQNQLNEEERLQLFSSNQPPKFIVGLKSCEAKITEDFRFTVQGEMKLMKVTRDANRCVVRCFVDWRYVLCDITVLRQQQGDL